jgi:hypothetical protein
MGEIDRKRIEHSGAWQGFSCEISRYPDDSLTVVVLTNLDSGHSNPGTIAHVVAGLAHPPLLPPKLAAIPDAQPAIATSLSRLLDQIVASEDIRSQTTPELATNITPDATTSVQHRLSTLWPGGTLILVKRTTLHDGGVKPTSMFRLSKSGETLLVSFAVDAGGKISTLSFSQDREYE